MPANNKGLGKGFDILMPKGFSVSGVTTSTEERVHKLAVDTVTPNSDQPRKYFDEKLLEQLARSISEQGILQPIVVFKNEHNMYSIIAGERRWRAAQMVGLKTIPSIIRSATEHQRLELGLLENVQRSDLTAIEQALSIAKLHNQFNQSYEEIAKRLGKGYTTIVNLVRLLTLPEYALVALGESKISEGHARTLLSLQKYPDQQKKLFNLIIEKGISVRQAEQYVVSSKKINTDKTDSSKNKNYDKNIKLLVDRIAVNLGSKTTLQHSNRGSGKLVVTYKSEADLETILSKLANLK